MTDKRDLLPAEDSVPLRMIVFLMTMTCIAASCIFVKTAWYVVVLTVALALIGSVVSYQYRNEKQRWMQAVVFVGVFAVGANSLSEFMDPTTGQFDFWGPVVHFVAGTFALHTFDLKSRSDINLSALLGALILCFLSPVARSMYFGLAVFNYICLGTVMLYFDCMSRTLHNWLTKPMLPAPIINIANTGSRRKPRGNVGLTVALLPLISALCFLLVPRSDNLVDNILASLKHLDFNSVMKMMPTFSPSAPNIDIPRRPYDGGKNVKVEAKKHKREDIDDKKIEEKPKEKPADKKVEEKDKKKEQEKKEQEDKAKQQQKSAAAKKNADKKKGAPPRANPPKKHGAGNPERIKNNRPKDNKLGNDFIDLDTDPADSTELVFRVNANRLFYSRRQVFDAFDGRCWKHSKAKIKPTDIEVKDPNEVKLPAKDATAPNPEEPAPEKELTPEEEAEKELQQEKLNELSKRDTGFGPDMAVNYVFNDPPKGDYHIDQASALRLPAKLPCVSLSQTFEVAKDIDAAFPAAWIPQDLIFKGKKVTVDDYGQIINSDNFKKGTKFKITSQWPVYNLKHMREEPAISEERENEIRDQLSNYLEIPEQSEEVLALADSFAGKTGNWFVVAERICLNMRTAASIEMDKPVDYKPEEDRIKDFLIDRKVGNHKDFTTAYVILCRAVGLPARVVSGFNTGSFNKDSGTQEIRMTDAMTWAEVYIPDYGWVPFDASPDGVMPGVKRDEGFSFWNVLKWLCHLLGIDIDDEGLTPKKILAIVSIVFSCLFLLGGIILGVVLLLRWRRNRSKHPWKDDAWKIWNDLAKDFKKARMERQESETPMEFVERINKIVKEQRRQGSMVGYEMPSLLKEFFETYEAVHFGNKEGLPVLKSQAEELRKMVKANKVTEKKAAASSSALRSPRK